MPGGDRTGPMGMGPMTGRAAADIKGLWSHVSDKLGELSPLTIL